MEPCTRRLRIWIPLLPTLFNRWISNRNTKSLYSLSVVRKSLYLMPGDLPTIIPFSTFQRNGSPCHPVKSSPLNRGTNPSSAPGAIPSAGNAEIVAMKVRRFGTRVFLNIGIVNPEGRRSPAKI